MSYRKSEKIMAFFLAGLLLLTGCGIGQGGEGQKDEDVPSGKQEEGAVWNPEEEILYARYREISLGDSRREERKKLIKMECLATEQGVYVTGIRNTQGVMEAVFYLLTQDAEPCLVAACPRERAIAWCGTDEGIAFLGARASQEDDFRAEYILHFLKWDAASTSLIETETIDLTECFAEAEAKDGFRGAMAVGEDSLFFGDLMEQRIFTVKRSDPMEYKWIEAGDYVNGIWCGDTGETFVLTAEGNLYSWPEEGETLKAEGSFGQSGIGGYCFLGKGRVYSGSKQSLYAYEMGGNKSQKLMDYEIGLMNQSSLWLDEHTGTGVLASWDSDGDTVQCYFLTTFPAAEEKEETREKEVVYLEQWRVSDEIKQAVAAFNQQSDTYQVKITEAGKTMEYEAYWPQLQTRLVAGNGPDLVDASSNSRFKSLVKAGAFEDLASYIERDLNAEDYVQSALYAYKMEGGVYALGPAFVLSVVVADRRLAGDGADWSLSGMFRMMEESGIDVLCKGNTSDILLGELCLPGLSDQIYDMEKVAECILFAEKYGETEQRVQPQDGRTIPGRDVGVVTELIRNPLDLPDILRYYGENSEVYGYPAAEGSSAFSEFTHGALSISATSGNKEGAWAFLKFLLEDEYQWAVKDAFPVLKDAFDSMLQQYQTPDTYDVYIEETGELRTVSRGYTLNRCSQENGWQQVEIERMSEEEIQDLRRLADQSESVIGRVEFYANQIILEEVQSYYQGDKPLEDVLKIIEGRLEMLQAEQGGE